MDKDTNAVTNVVIVGVGGQGILLASTIVSRVAVLAGHDVKNNEVHGMAQRGGSVISQIRFGPRVYSPLVMKGTAHFLLALEEAEALRYLYLCNGKTAAVVNSLQIVPVTVTSGKARYPENAEQVLRKQLPDCRFIQAQQIAEEVGNIRTMNVVLIGAISNLLPFEADAFEEAIKSSVKPKFVDINIEAFQRGRAVTAS